MSKPVGSISATRGVQFAYQLQRSGAGFDGTETVSSVIKDTLAGGTPLSTAPVLVATTASFTPANGATPSAWVFSVSAAQSAMLIKDTYITDAKIVLQSGAVEQPKPLLIVMNGVVTT